MEKSICQKSIYAAPRWPCCVGCFVIAEGPASRAETPAFPWQYPDP